MTENYKVEELENMKVDELKIICKENGLPCYKGKSKLTKSEMIANILGMYNNTESNEVNESQNVTTDEVVETVQEVVEKPEIDVEGFFHTKDKERYIEQAEVGTLIAFIDENGKPRTAAIQNRSSKRRVLKVVTEFAREFIVPYEKVLWVRNGNRWPNGVYRLLKEYKNGNKNLIKK